jgi:hypothetical protein
VRLFTCSQCGAEKELPIESDEWVYICSPECFEQFDRERLLA